jgi:hypothetical protein
VRFFGGKIKEMYYLATAPGAVCTGLVCLSTMNRMKVNICSDKYQIDDIDFFIGCFNEFIKEYGLQLDDADKKEK